MIWSDELLERVVRQLINSTYTQVADELSRDVGVFVHPEQLRGAVRRYKSRRQAIINIEGAHARMHAHTHAHVRAHARVPVPEHRDVVVRFGAVGDTHLCSNYEQLEALRMMYDIFQREGIRTVYHTGNFVDGEARFNMNDIHIRGMDNQLRYFIDNYPRCEGITTYFISGDDHEGWYTQNTGVEVGLHLEDMAKRFGRTDLVYLGYMEADVEIAPDVILRVAHPGGGSAYALSHTSQKIVDSYETYDRPLILLAGHYHKAEFLPDYKGVYVIQTGAFQAQTPFMRKKRLHTDIGGWIVQYRSEAGITRMQAEFVRFPSTTAWRYVMAQR